MLLECLVDSTLQRALPDPSWIFGKLELLDKKLDALALDIAMESRFAVTSASTSNMDFSDVADGADPQTVLILLELYTLRLAIMA